MNEKRALGMFLDLLSEDISKGRLEDELPADVVSFAGNRSLSDVDVDAIVEGEVDI